MRTNVVLDDQLMTLALKSGKFRTKKSAIEAGLRLLVQMDAQRKLRGLRGRVHWEGNLAENAQGLKLLVPLRLEFATIKV